MPDGARLAEREAAAEAAPPRPRRRWVSPLLRRILLVNALPPALLAAALLYLDQYQNALLAGEIEAMRTQARIYAGAIGEAAVRIENDRAVLVPELARPLLRRLVDPSPNTQARIFDTAGLVVADSRVREAPGGVVITEPLPPPLPRGALSAVLGRLYERLLALLPRLAGTPVVVDTATDEDSFDWQPALGPDRREELRIALEGGLTPYIRRTPEGRLLISVAEPARRGAQPVAILLLTREAREVEQRLFEIRLSVLGLFALALLLTLLLSLYLAQTLAAPILRLAAAAGEMRQGRGRQGSVPEDLLARRDEIGILARDLQQAARALWARIDANERFAADVAHELKNPLTSMRSAIETLRRVEDVTQQKRLLGIIAEDV
ncbi:MAG: stimulus-sensing domain-containing protein, partial [Rhodovarius sp.]|nr:stimulus-sensing domain-containing protein [Rhodovarius sp.]